MSSLTALPASADQDPRWAAVLARDPEADFLISVRSTGIYCRPSCPARRPHPRHVGYHRDPESARAAGFRACLRCRPDGPSERERRAALAADACRRIEAATGVTPRAYAAAHRARRLREALGEGASVTEAIYDAGFNAPSRAYEAADGLLGMAPSRYRKGGDQAAIRFATGPSSLGEVLVARTDRGLCAIQLGDDAEALAAELRARFPRADVSGPDPALAADLEAVIAAVEDPRRGLHLPLDIQGTAFQQQVWAALSAVPAGETVTYGELAARAGRPGAARAAGAACGENKLAVVIPCHRAIGRSGALTGYRWGVERKRALLARETDGG